MVRIGCDRMHRLNHRNSTATFLRTFGFVVALCAVLAGCSGGGGATSAPPPTPPPEPPPTPQSLTQSDVTAVVQAAATAAQSDTMAIAVVDRLGRILAVYEGPAAPAL